MLTRAPAGTMMCGLTRPAARKVSSGPADELARMVSRTVAVVKVMALAALLTWAPVGTWLPSAVAWAALARGPGAFAHRLPMILPGSVPVPVPIIPVPIMAD